MSVSSKNQSETDKTKVLLEKDSGLNLEMNDLRADAFRFFFGALSLITGVMVALSGHFFVGLALAFLGTPACLKSVSYSFSRSTYKMSFNPFSNLIIGQAPMKLYLSLWKERKVVVTSIKESISRMPVMDVEDARGLLKVTSRDNLKTLILHKYIEKASM